MQSDPVAPFTEFAPPVRPATPLRAAITAAYRRPEAECVVELLDDASPPNELCWQIRRTAAALVTRLRAARCSGGVEGLVREYSLSTREGVALMCLAEALLRVPDNATRDALIRDKVITGDWRAHLGGDRPLFVNAATWGLAMTGKLVGCADERGLAAALARLIARGGEPLIRRGVEVAMRLMGDQFVTGETIRQALTRARLMEARGFGYSYDMLGEAAVTAADADRYMRDYEAAVEAIGYASAGRGVYSGPGISIKLSALHPRYSRAQAGRVMTELLPRLKTLAMRARTFDIGFNIDAEESERLELSLDLLESLALDPDLAGWDGLGFVVQAYGKRCPQVIDWIVDLAGRAGRRIMVRLVKGAYWDAEIKRTQVDGLTDFPVFTRKVYTDVSYIACARRLLAARGAVFPQFATHNAQTVATIYHMAGPDFVMGDYEFQCLHGMGEPLYEQVVGPNSLDRPCRIYAPVGTHETLLAYLARRLLENGANSSFVNRIADPQVPIADLVADPVGVVRGGTAEAGTHPGIRLPRNLHTDRRNSAGLDLSDERVLDELGATMRSGTAETWTAGEEGTPRLVRNPADHRDQVGVVTETTPERARRAAAVALAATPCWAEVPPSERAAALDRAADLMQARMPVLIGLIVREAGKTAANAIGEVREAIDFLRYYAEQARLSLGPVSVALGPVVCISPWNFPLAIFIGQVAAALVGGNPVLAKPAEETPLVAARGVAILHEAGVPRDVLQLICGDGSIGAALVNAPETRAVMFTGSTEVARLIQRTLATRLLPDGAPVPLIAETGGQNAMIVDSSALAEQVVADVMASAFDSAGQRCSALRVLFLQDEIADRTLTMVKGALHELLIGCPDRLAVDIGPVITADARTSIEAHVARMEELGHRVERVGLPGETAHGTFVAPTIIELDDLDDLGSEVFGPVLHVVRYRRSDLDRVIDRINGTGYGLTFGLHTRLDETIARVTARIRAGNLYVNRNVIGAVVGVQPFGGRGLSGTGPKAGGPLYLGRLVTALSTKRLGGGKPDLAACALASWLEASGDVAGAERVRNAIDDALVGCEMELEGPVGERNVYALHPRGRLLLVPGTRDGLIDQLAVALAAGNDVLVAEADWSRCEIGSDLPDCVLRRVRRTGDWRAEGPFAGALIEDDGRAVTDTLAALADLPGSIVLPQASSAGYRPEWLVEEVSTSINTTAAGGNASLMALGAC